MNGMCDAWETSSLRSRWRAVFWGATATCTSPAFHGIRSVRSWASSCLPQKPSSASIKPLPFSILPHQAVEALPHTQHSMQAHSSSSSSPPPSPPSQSPSRQSLLRPLPKLHLPGRSAWLLARGPPGRILRLSQRLGLGLGAVGAASLGAGWYALRTTLGAIENEGGSSWAAFSTAAYLRSIPHTARAIWWGLWSAAHYKALELSYKRHVSAEQYKEYVADVHEKCGTDLVAVLQVSTNNCMALCRFPWTGCPLLLDTVLYKSRDPYFPPPPQPLFSSSSA